MRMGRHHGDSRGHHHHEGRSRGRGERFEGHEHGRRRRMFESGDFRILLLTLLEEQARHGYELIRAIEEMFAGQYAPSPGIVYPTLAMLEEQGLAQPTAEGSEDGRKRFAITAAGTQWLKDNAAAVTGVRARLALEVKSLRSNRLPESVRQAVRTLKHALMLDQSEWPEARAQRVLQAIGRAIEAVGADPSG